MKPTVDYFFTVASPWAYLALEPFCRLVQKYEIDVRPRVITIIPENGAIPLNDRPEARRNYIRQDLRRWANIRGKSLMLDDRPDLQNANQAASFVTAAIIDGQDWAALTLALQRDFWEKAADVGQESVRSKIADSVGLDGARLIAREQAVDVVEAREENMRFATANGVFGSPTFIYDDQIYWGQDNLHFLEEHLAGRPLVEARSKQTELV